MKRGELRLVAGGVYASKPRPAVIVQAEWFDSLNSVVVCPVTTTARDAPLLRVQVGPDRDTGLERVSYIQVDKLTVVRGSNVGALIGVLPHDVQTQLDRLLLLFLGLAR
ncbi:MAG: type II toxin-antitoxin system PemK/MazF family toxin [Bifidobacteriaceae bacterium]|jgi:mRNA interferase MazF|nr:type II toxin-antitoxin system PemK/MazF family toxin [Bifidobacteriaceae bacterium]